MAKEHGARISLVIENYKDTFPSLLKKQYGKKLQVSVSSKNEKAMGYTITRGYATMFTTYTKQSVTVMIRSAGGTRGCP